MVSVIRPFFSFYGSKWRVAKRYPKPECDTIIEPFAGSAGYSLRYPDRQVILIDKDERISETWRYLIGAHPEEIQSLPDVPDGGTVYDLDLTIPQRYLIGWWLNKGGASPCATPSKWMREPRYRSQFWGPRIRERIASHLKHIRHWKVMHAPFEEAPDIKATWFVDPPYEVAGKHYRESDVDRELLAGHCRHWQSQVIVCENEGADWLPFRPWRKIKANNATQVSREAIWTNT